MDTRPCNHVPFTRHLTDALGWRLGGVFGVFFPGWLIIACVLLQPFGTLAVTPLRKMKERYVISLLWDPTAPCNKVLLLLWVFSYIPTLRVTFTPRQVSPLCTMGRIECAKVRRLKSRLLTQLGTLPLEWRENVTYFRRKALQSPSCPTVVWKKELDFV